MQIQGDYLRKEKCRVTEKEIISPNVLLCIGQKNLGVWSNLSLSEERYQGWGPGDSYDE